MYRVRVKICGITRPEDAIAAANAGADAIGLVFYSHSPRQVDIDRAKSIIRVLPPFITKVGLFVDATDDYIKSIVNQVYLDILQFHGKETPEQCRAYSKPYIKAVRMQDNIDLQEISREYYDASAILLDSYVEGTAGGTGSQFNWKQIPELLDKPVILAGGLSPENVITAIQQTRPYAVDVSSGVESTKGIKDNRKIAAFLNAVMETVGGK